MKREEELQARYRAAINRIITDALPGESFIVRTNLHVVPGVFPDPRTREALQFVVAHETGEDAHTVTAGADWYLKADELVRFTEQLAESESMRKKLADALADLPPHQTRLSRAVDFIYSELIAKKGGYGDF